MTRKHIHPLTGESEDSIQMRLAQYLKQLALEGRGVLWYTATTPNIRTPFIGVRVKNKRMGLNRGLHDMIVVFGQGKDVKKVVYFELKTYDGSATKWQKGVNQLMSQACKYSGIFKGYDAAKERIDEVIWLELGELPERIKPVINEYAYLLLDEK